MKSEELQRFIKEIKYKNRNPTDNCVLDLIKDISTNPEKPMASGMILYRSRIIKDRDKNQINKSPKFYGYGKNESFVPPQDLACDMRANYRYIPYLYCTNDPYLSVLEVRPRFGAWVSVAKIRLTENIRLLDFTMSEKPLKKSRAKQNLFDELSELFAIPITDDDNIIDYIPTQYIAEYAKNLGYDGIAFKSSIYEEMNMNLNVSNKMNVVIFNYEKCFPESSNVYKITYSTIECEQIDKDNVRKNIVNPTEEELRQI